jgi:uncharacterized protein
MTGDPGTGSPGDLWKREKCYTLSWEMLGACLEELRRCIVRDRFFPTVVVGIARGGLVPASFFANALHTTRFVLVSIRRNSTNEVYSEKQDPQLAWISSQARLDGEHVLLVDDVTGSGETLRFTCALLAARGAEETRTVVLARMRHSTFVPNYVGVTLDDWIIFPWENAKSPIGKIVPIGARDIPQQPYSSETGAGPTRPQEAKQEL